MHFVAVCSVESALPSWSCTSLTDLSVSLGAKLAPLVRCGPIWRVVSWRCLWQKMPCGRALLPCQGGRFFKQLVSEQRLQLFLCTRCCSVLVLCIDVNLCCYCCRCGCCCCCCFCCCLFLVAGCLLVVCLFVVCGLLFAAAAAVAAAAVVCCLLLLLFVVAAAVVHSSRRCACAGRILLHVCFGLCIGFELFCCPWRFGCLRNSFRPFFVDTMSL